MSILKQNQSPNMSMNMDNMNLVIEPETYSPSINEEGHYVDQCPHASAMHNGIRCPCGSRRDKVFDTTSSFNTHMKSKCHQIWLATLNLNKKNYFQESEELKITVQNQRLIIARLEKELSCKLVTIDILTQHLALMRTAADENELSKPHVD